MIEATAVMKTETASKYLMQMCKHFAHKVNVEFSETHGECRFDGGLAVFDASAHGLAITVSATGEELLLWAQQAIDSHLIRFAFRENFEGLVWRPHGKAD